MDGVTLFRLGRALMRIGENSLPEPPGGLDAYPGSTRAVLLVTADLAENSPSSISRVVTRTGLAQSQVSTAVARLHRAGAVTIEADATDRRRVMVSAAPAASERMDEVRSGSVTTALEQELGVPDRDGARRLEDLLDQVAEELLPDRGRGA
jgi:DNA-binding MarR family transcriptional regulator